MENYYKKRAYIKEKREKKMLLLYLFPDRCRICEEVNVSRRFFVLRTTSTLKGKTNGLLLYGVTLLFETKKQGSFGVMSRQSKPVPKEGFSPSFETDFYGFCIILKLCQFMKSNNKN